MRRLIVDLEARIGEVAILNSSFLDFGPAAATRYSGLIKTSYDDLRQSPVRAGSVHLEDGVYLYHLRHSARRLPMADRVKHPRHIIAYVFTDDVVEIVALFHDSMDIPARLRGDAPD